MEIDSEIQRVLYREKIIYQKCRDKNPSGKFRKKPVKSINVQECKLGKN